MQDIDMQTRIETLEYELQLNDPTPRDFNLVGVFSAPSGEFTSFDLDFRAGDLLVSYTYQSASADREAGVYFANVLGFRQRADIYCGDWHLQAHDRVVEVEDSDWARDLRGAALPQWRDHWAIRHFMLYVDGEGAFEIIAEDVLMTPDVAI